MSKVIVIERCWDCRHLHPVVDWMGKCEKINKGVGNPKERIPDWCPLPDLPEKMLTWHDDEQDDYEMGWNACLDAITGG